MSYFSRRRALAGAVFAVSLSSPALGDAFFANQVIDYSAGNDPNNVWLTPSSALDKPTSDTGFGVLTPFNSAFSDSHIVGVGKGGSITLKLAKTAASAGYSIGIHSSVGVTDSDWPNGESNGQPDIYTNPRVADFQVSLDGVNWVDLGTKNFTIPTNYWAQGVTTPGYQEAPGTVEADWAKPFTQPVSSLLHTNWTNILSTLDGSGGGDWFNLSAPQLAGINYVRFNVASNAPYPMIIDSVVGNTDNQTNTGTRNVSSSPIVEAPQGTILTNTGTLFNTGTVTVLGATPQAGSAVLNYGTIRSSTGPTMTFNVPVYSEGGTFATVEGIIQLNGRFITGSGTTTKSGNGTLIINGPQYHNPGSSFVASQGTTKFQTDAAGLAITTSAKVELNSQQHLASLQVNATGSVVSAVGGTRTLYTNALSIATGGKLDLNDNDLVVNNGVFSAVQALVFNGYFTTVDTTKKGITSTIGQNTSGVAILALFNNAFFGVTDYPFGSGNSIAAGAIVGKYTYIGDTDWDGQVTPQDYTAIDANLGATGLDLGLSWFSGDTNFDGNIDPSDYTGIDAALGLGVGNPLGAAGQVPEPATLSLLVGFGSALLARRRRR
jgi:hypothetical protein